MLVKHICSSTPKIGEVGIEIEVEGSNLPAPPVGWRKVSDGSLRGESCEYVLKTPCARGSVTKYLDRMKEANEEANFEFSYSTRQSIHVHINVQELNLVQLYNFITLFLIFESELVRWCGEDREHNLFCLQTKDAEGLISTLEKAATPKTYHLLSTDSIRYSALNISSIYKFGSLEFRSMRGTDDYLMIQRWIDILLNIKDVALTYESPIDIVEDVSLLGVERFALKVLGEENIDLVHDVQSIMEGARQLQTMAYTGDWVGMQAIKERETTFHVPGGMFGTPTHATDWNTLNTRAADRLNALTTSLEEGEDREDDDEEWTDFEDEEDEGEEEEGSNYVSGIDVDRAIEQMRLNRLRREQIQAVVEMPQEENF